MARKRVRRRPKFQDKASWVGLFLLLDLLVGFFVFNFTSLPFQYLARTLRPQGWQFEGIAGSLRSGYRASIFIYHGAQFTLELHDLVFHYEPSLSLSQLNLSSIVTGTGTLTLQTSTPAKTYAITRLVIKMLKLDARAGTINIARLFEEGPSADVNAQRVKLDRDGNVLVQDLAYITIKPAFAPDKIRAPIDFQISGEYSGKTLQRATVTGFRNSVHWDWVHGLSHLHVRNLNVASYLNTEIPLRDLQMDVAFEMRKLSELTTKGSFDWRGHRFVMNKGAFLAEEGAALYMAVPQIMAYQRVWQGTEKPFMITSKRHEDARETLAQLLYRQPVAGLKPEQLALIVHDSRYFADVQLAPDPTPVSAANSKARATASAAKSRPASH